MIVRFIARRLVIFVLQLVGITASVFVLIRLLPADPVAQLVGMNASRDAYEQSKHALGLDRPMWQQFLGFVGLDGKHDGLLQGNLGTSWVSSQPVGREILDTLPVTLEIVTIALLIAFAVALPLGLASARKPGGIADRASLIWGLFAGAQPDYWWGLLFVFVFFYLLNWAPPPMGRFDPLMTAPHEITGFITIDSLLAGDLGAFWIAVQYLSLPILTLAFVVSGAIIKMVRTNTLRALQSDYILYARASGLPERMVARYALRAALTPAVTLVGIFYGVLLSSAVTVEIVFSLNGIGQYAVRSVLAFDYPAIQGTVLVVAMVSLLIYLMLDIVHAYLDPASAADGADIPMTSGTVALGVRRRRGVLLPLGIAIIALSLFLAAFGPMISPYDPTVASSDISVAPPGLTELPGLLLGSLRGTNASPPHWMGTDQSGLDIFSRLISAPRMDMTIALSAAILSCVFGTLIGLLAGYVRNWATESMMRVSDVLQAFPVFITAMMLVALAGRSPVNIVIALVLVYTPIFVRLTRAEDDEPDAAHLRRGGARRR